MDRRFAELDRHGSSLSVNSKARQRLFGCKSVFGTVRRMTDETPDYMTDEVPEYTADELGDHDDLLAEGLVNMSGGGAWCAWPPVLYG